MARRWSKHRQAVSEKGNPMTKHVYRAVERWRLSGGPVEWPTTDPRSRADVMGATEAIYKESLGYWQRVERIRTARALVRVWSPPSRQALSAGPCDQCDTITEPLSLSLRGCGHEWRSA